MVDMRSDTVTLPTPGMLKAIAEAEAGDDCYGEDPTANRLQETAAEIFGKEAALFVPSGTMANQVCLKAWTRPGDEALADKDSHVCNYEAGAPAALSGVTFRLLDGARGILSPAQVEAALRPEKDHLSATRLVAIENTHNLGGGSVYPVETVRGIGEVCRRHDLMLHMDGARLLNACIAQGVEPSDYAQHVDSVTLCFSKGLGCPVGSIVAGSREFVHAARRARKLFGGGMRQIGYLAAAAIYALENNVERLREDHDNARAMAEGIAEIGLLRLKSEPATNMVYFDVLPPLTAERLSSGLRAADILIMHAGGTTFRAVCHLQVTRRDIEAVLRALREICAKH